MDLTDLRQALLLTPFGLLAAADPGRTNIVVMIVDDLGYGDVGFLHQGVVRTPNIDRIAAAGVTCTAGYVTAPLSGPSRAGFYTGRYPQRFGFNGNRDGIPVGEPLRMPGVFHAAGYRTALLGKWHSSGPLPAQRGCFDETLCSAVPSPFIDYHHPRLSRNGSPQTFDTYSTDLFAQEAEAFIERNQDGPFALTVAFNAPHILRVVEDHRKIRADHEAAVATGRVLDIPKVPTARPGEAAAFAARFPGDTARADTVATITALDQAVGRILDKLRQTGLDRRTMVVFFSDNGGHPELRSENLPLRDYKWTVYEGGIRVPFVMSCPGVLPAGLTYDHPVSTLDLLPTCAAMAGIPAPPGIDGVDLTPHLLGRQTAPPHKSLFFRQDGVGAIRQGDWKLIIPQGTAPSLFDLVHDAGERRDLAAAEPARVQEMLGTWQDWNDRMPVITRPPAK